MEMDTAFQREAEDATEASLKYFIIQAVASSSPLFLVIINSDSGPGGETDVSLNCGRFYGPSVRPRVRMSEMDE
jgi:hypothetical protein